MEIYKYTGTKIIAFNSSTNQGFVDTNISDSIPLLTKQSQQFEIKNIGVFADVKSLLESPFSFANSNDTELQKWDRDRELLKQFSNIRIEFKISDNILFTSFITGSTIPYDFTINKSVSLNSSQILAVNLVNTGHGLLSNLDKIVLHFPYELTILGAA